MRGKKPRILYLYKILKENTDDANGITMAQIIEQLQSYQIDAERKSIYNDLKDLREYGYKIEMRKMHSKSMYYLKNEENISLNEAKLLIQSVKASTNINKDKTDILIQKIKELVNPNSYKGLSIHDELYDRDLRNISLDQYKTNSFSTYNQKFLNDLYTDKMWKVTLRCKNNLAGIIAEKFGKVQMSPDENYDYFLITVNVTEIEKKSFLSWVFEMGNEIQIVSPQEAINAMHEHLQNILPYYGLSAVAAN